jgi:hypothetical protein
MNQTTKFGAVILYTVNPACSCFEDGLPYAYSRTRNAKEEIKDNNVISNNMLCLDNALLNPFPLRCSISAP